MSRFNRCPVCHAYDQRNVGKLLDKLRRILRILKESVELCFLSPHSDPEAALGEPDAGGQCVYEHQLAQALTDLEGQRNTVITLCRDTGARSAVSHISERYSIHRIRCGPPGFIPKEELGPYLPEFADAAAEVLRRWPAQALANSTPSQGHNGRSLVFHGHYWDGGAAGLMMKARLLTEAPLVWTPHSLGSAKRKKFPGSEHESEHRFVSRLFWENATLSAASCALVSSAHEERLLLSEYAHEEEKIRIIPPGITTETLVRVDQKKARIELGIPLESRTLICLGRLTPFKGYHHALDALPLIQKQSAEPVVLVIIGGSEEGKRSHSENHYLARLQEQARALGISDSVLFRPAVAHANINLVYSAADIQLSMSEHEPFGLTALEAMACGTPVVATKNGGPSSFITHNVTGSLVDVQNPSRIASYVLALLKDATFYANMQESARKFAHEHFSWSSKAEHFAQTYAQALKTQALPFSEWLKTHYIAQTMIAKR